MPGAGPFGCGAASPTHPPSHRLPPTLSTTIQPSNVLDTTGRGRGRGRGRWAQRTPARLPPFPPAPGPLSPAPAPAIHLTGVGSRTYVPRSVVELLSLPACLRAAGYAPPGPGAPNAPPPGVDPFSAAARPVCTLRISVTLAGSTVPPLNLVLDARTSGSSWRTRFTDGWRALLNRLDAGAGDSVAFARRPGGGAGEVVASLVRMNRGKEEKGGGGGWQGGDRPTGAGRRARPGQRS